MPGYMVTSNGYREYYARVPFYWSSAHLWQKALKCGEAMPIMVIPGMIYLFGITILACSIAASVWFVIPTVILSLIAIIQAACMTKIRMMDWINYQDHANFRIEQYRKLPRNIRRKLRPAARYIHKNSRDLTNSELSNWHTIIDGYSRLYPYAPKPVVKRGRAKIEKEAQKIHKLILQDDIQRAKIEQQRKIEREIELEVKERVKAQLLAEGKEYIELNV